MESPVKRAGWSGLDSHGGERKRRGRAVDTIHPTPPRARPATHLPTPETGHRRKHSKPLDSSLLKPSTISTSRTSLLPTPETLPRPAKRAQHSGTDTPPSPSGHTTFFLSSSSQARHDGPAPTRRRPGLTFAQQMGLVQPQAGPSTFGGRLGVGVGMGGLRSAAHHGRPVDQVAMGVQLEEEENPFLDTGRGFAGLKSPGMVTSHVPGDVLDEEEREEMMASPLASSPARPAVKHRVPPPPAFTSAAGLLSPPPTRHRHKTRRPHDKGKQELAAMLDASANPFLSRASDADRHPHPEDDVDETKPTVTYVFRGAKKVFANPFFGADRRFIESEYDPADEDFEPHPCPKPRLLWPTAPANGIDSHMEERTPSPPSSPIMETPAPRRFGRNASGELEEEEIRGPSTVFTPEAGGVNKSDAEEDDEEDMPVRRGLLFGGGMKRRGDELDQAGRGKGKKARRPIRA